MENSPIPTKISKLSSGLILLAMIVAAIIVGFQGCGSSGFKAQEIGAASQPIPTSTPTPASTPNPCPTEFNFQNGSCVLASPDFRLHGFDVSVRGSALTSPHLQNAVALLKTKLNQAITVNPKLNVLAGQMKFWLTDSKWQGSAMTFHISALWLTQNGMDPAMARGAEILNLENFLAWTVDNDQPMMVFHELCHGYNDFILGWNYAPIIQAYMTSVGSGIYDSVPYHSLGGQMLPAYAKSGAGEYFAELSEAYFGKNDYFPFIRTDIQPFDVEGWNLMQLVWTPY